MWRLYLTRTFLTLWLVYHQKPSGLNILSSIQSMHVLYRSSQRESLSEQYGVVTLVQWQRNIFILDIRFLSISVHVVVLYVVIVMYLYLFSRIKYSCMAGPFIQLSKNTHFYWVICYYHAVIRNFSCQGTKNGILEKWRFLGQILVENMWVRKG